MPANLKDLICKSRDKILLFHMLDEDEIGEVIPYLEAVDYPKGAVVFNEGDPGDFAGFITAGQLEVKKETEFKNKQIVIATLGEGSLVGELSLIDTDLPRSASVVALENSELIILRKEALDSIIEKYPVIAVKILKGLNQIIVIRLRKAVERLAYIF